MHHIALLKRNVLVTGYTHGSDNTQLYTREKTAGDERAIQKVVYSVSDQVEIREVMHLTGPGVTVPPVEKLLQNKK